MSIVLDLPYNVCVWISAATVIIYTLMGGFYSVAYTDIIQLLLIFISLVSTLAPHADPLRIYKELCFVQS